MRVTCLNPPIPSVYKKAARFMKRLVKPKLSTITMTATAKEQTNIRLFLTIICLSAILGWFTPSIIDPLCFSPKVHHEKATTLQRAVNESVEAYRNQYRTFPDPSQIALLSETAAHLEYSVGYFESPSSEELTEGLRNASVILDEFWQRLVDLRRSSDDGIYYLTMIPMLETYTGDMDTETFNERITPIIKTIDELTNTSLTCGPC